MYRYILVIPDQHFPAQHIDMFPFIKKVLEVYGKPDKVVNLGDELDYHVLSFHENSVDDMPYSESSEFEEGKRYFSQFYDMFDEMDILESNHGSMVFRKANSCRIPRKFLRTYQEVLDAPVGYHWHKNLILDTPCGPVNFSHGNYAPKDIMRKSQLRSMSQVQGHYHNDFEIKYWKNDLNQTYFGMTCGCLIDDDTYAFLYNKTYIPRPMLGIGLIIDGVPELIPMHLDDNKRWTGNI